MVLSFEISYEAFSSFGLYLLQILNSTNKHRSIKQMIWTPTRIWMSAYWETSQRSTTSSSSDESFTGVRAYQCTKDSPDVGHHWPHFPHSEARQPAQSSVGSYSAGSQPYPSSPVHTGEVQID